MNSPVIFHVDMDAFFAAIEQRDNPKLQNAPVVVGARPGQRGVVCAASYEARRYGIHSALPVSTAYARCPQAVFLPPDMEKYRRESSRLMDLLETFTPQYEPISVDEAFLDMTGTQKLFGAPKEAAVKIQQAIRSELHLPASIGVGPNKLLAKIGSNHNKPEGITMLPFEESAVREWLKPQGVSVLWGIGEKTTERLAVLKIKTVEDLWHKSMEELISLFGKQGRDLFYRSRGIDLRKVQHRETAKSIGREQTFQRDTGDFTLVRNTLLRLCNEVCARARRQNLYGTRLTLIYRNSAFVRRTLSVTQSVPANSTGTIFTPLLRKLEQHWPRIQPLRLIGISLSGFSGEMQQSFMPEEDRNLQWDTSDSLLDLLSHRFADIPCNRGSLL
ncbi:MAG: DNA polymerase IV [Fibrobacterota bacterium]